MGLSVAARFDKGSAARRAYTYLTHKVASADLKLSCFRFFSDPYWYIAVVGDETDLQTFVPLAEILARSGTIIALPDETHDGLLAKRARDQKDYQIRTWKPPI